MVGELTTVNYGWTKPTVDGSDDAWGGYINTDLDGIDAIVKGVSVVANAAYPASNPSGYQTAAQVASVVIGDNRIINGDMRIDQRNAGASGTAISVYTVDRWLYNTNQASKGTWGRGGPGVGVLTATGCPYLLSFTSSSAYTSLAADVFSLQQPIEADMVSDFAWGTANAQSATLSFWVSCTLPGTFGGSIRNDTGSRSYPFSFQLPASVWTKIVVTIPGDTTGTWVMGGNAKSVQVCFDLGTGATARGPANAWASANYVGVTGAVSVVGTNGASLSLTGVKLEIGSVATPYNRQSLSPRAWPIARGIIVGLVRPLMQSGWIRILGERELRLILV